MAHTTHWNTHVHIWRQHRTHTHAGRPEVTVNLFSAFSHAGASFLKDSPGAVCSLKRPGTKVSQLYIFGHGWTCVLLFCMFFLLGSLVEETPCEHGENMQTPHRKAREIAHLSPVHSGEDLPPRANCAPCGNRTHDLLAVRRQCKHRAT